jgi:DNA ligase (NAD+)
LHVEKETSKTRSSLLEGKSVIISGTFNRFSRDEIKRLIEEHGGKNVSSISTRTDFLVAGENIGPAKLKKAESIQLEIISEEEFLARIGML